MAVVLGKLYLGALIHSGDLSKYMHLGDTSHLFRGTELPVEKFVRDFVKQYGAFPSADTIHNHTGEEITCPKEPVDYFYDLLVMRFREASLKVATKKIADFLLPDVKDLDSAEAVLFDTTQQLTARRFQTSLGDFRDAIHTQLPAYVAQNTAAGDTGLKTGWPYLDAMTNGLGLGDMVSLVADTGFGKTWFMLYSALYGWRNYCDLVANGKGRNIPPQSRLFVSMEMGRYPVEQRLTAMHFHLPIQKYKTSLSTPHYKKLTKGLTELQGAPVPFWIVDGNLTATVDDIEMLARQLKPGGIWIDGGYLLKHPTEKDRYRRVAENAELIKSRLASLAPTFVSWQFAKGEKKAKKKHEKKGLDDIGSAIAIAQVSSLVLGIGESENEDGAVNALAKQRTINILKGRSGEFGSFPVNWDFVNMDFGQQEEKSIHDLAFTDESEEE